MPKIGEIQKGGSLGYKNKGNKFIWHACKDCGKERWVFYNRGCPINTICHPCSIKYVSGSGNHKWKGGINLTGEGYREVKLSNNDFFYSMTDKRGYIREHRLVMAKHLGRNLHRWEIVHHKHTKYPAGSIEDKQDNRIENLQLVSDDRHNQITLLENRIKRLEVKVHEQAKLIRLLQWQLKEA